MVVYVLAWAGLAVAQNMPTYGIQTNTIYAGADGKFESAPDTAVLHLDIASQQDTSKDAYDKVAAAATNVRTVLRNNGIDPKPRNCRLFRAADLRLEKSHGIESLPIG